MTKSTITRERLQQLTNFKGAPVTRHEEQELARIALAATDSEPVALQPELAKVIYHFRDWNEGFPVERFKADYVISWMLANYPPAQPAPVVMVDLLSMAASAIEDLLEHTDPNTSYYSGVWADMPGKLRAAMLRAEPVTTANKLREGIGAIRNSGTPIDDEKIQEERDSLNSPAIPDGYVMVPIEPTMSQELAGYKTLNDTGRMSRLMKTRLSNIYRAMLAAAPQEVK